MATTMDRTLTGSKPGVPNQRGGAAEPVDGAKAPRLTKKKKLLLGVVLLVVVLAGAGWFFLLGPGAGEAEVVDVEPVPGEVLPLEPITVNLSDGAYLQLGLALQATEEAGAHGPLDGSKALDIAIDLFSGRGVAELSAPEARQQLKAELTTAVAAAYHDEVYEVYFTEFVMQ